MAKRYCEVPGCESTVPMAEWIQKDPNNPDICRPCMLGLTANWYEDELKEQGKEDIASDLLQFRQTEGVEPIQVAQKLDEIKEQAEEPLRNRLLEFDCATQLYD